MSTHEDYMMVYYHNNNWFMVLVIWGLLSCGVDSQNNACEYATGFSDFKKFEKSCFWVSPTNDMKSRRNAQSICKRWNGNLATVATTETLNFLTSNWDINDSRFWIGLHINSSEFTNLHEIEDRRRADWKWLGGTKYDSQSGVSWFNGHPLQSEVLGLLQYPNWIAVQNPYRVNRYICETKLPKPSTTLIVIQTTRKTEPEEPQITSTPKLVTSSSSQHVAELLTTTQSFNPNNDTPTPSPRSKPNGNKELLTTTQPFNPNNYAPTPSPRSTPNGNKDILGIALGVISAFLVVALLAALLCVKRKKRAQNKSLKTSCLNICGQSKDNEDHYCDIKDADLDPKRPTSDHIYYNEVANGSCQMSTEDGDGGLSPSVIANNVKKDSEVTSNEKSDHAYYNVSVHEQPNAKTSEESPVYTPLKFK